MSCAAYVTKRQKCEDLRSSCFAFFLVGGICAACSAALHAMDGCSGSTARSFMRSLKR